MQRESEHAWRVFWIFPLGKFYGVWHFVFVVDISFYRSRLCWGHPLHGWDIDSVIRLCYTDANCSLWVVIVFDTGVRRQNIGRYGLQYLVRRTKGALIFKAGTLCVRIDFLRNEELVHRHTVITDGYLVHTPDSGFRGEGFAGSVQWVDLSRCTEHKVR